MKPIGLSRFRTAIVKETLVKVAYIPQEAVPDVLEGHLPESEPAFIGVGKLVDMGENTFRFKTVGSNIDDIFAEKPTARERAYRWIEDEDASSRFIIDGEPMSGTERMAYFLDFNLEKGHFPVVDVWVLDKVKEAILSRDISVEAPIGSYRQFDFVTIVNSSLYDENDNYIKDEFVCLVTDL